MRRLRASKQQNRHRDRNKTLVSVSLPLSRSPAQSLIRSNGAPGEKQPTAFRSRVTTQKFLMVFNSSSRNHPIKGVPGLLICPKINRLLGGRLALASMACLLADYDGDWRLRLLDYSRPTTNSVPVDGLAGGYEIAGWMLNDATEQQRRKKEGVMGGVLIQRALRLK